MGMELTERAFLWVVRQGIKRKNRKIVSWVSQQKVQKHLNWDFYEPLWVKFCNRRSQKWIAIYLLALCGRPFLEHEVHY